MSFNRNNKIDFASPISMETAIPLDYNSVFTNFDEATAAASKAVQIGGYGSKNYIGQLISIVDATSGIYKTYRIQEDKTLKELAAEYVFTGGLSESIDAYGNTNVTIANNIYNRINVTYFAIAESSGYWDSVYSTVRALSGKWDNTVNKFAEVSSTYDSTNVTVASLSGRWNYSYDVLNRWNKNWISTYYTLTNLSSDWQNNFSSVKETSSSWNTAYSYVTETSSDAESVYTTVHDTSSDWNETISRVDDLEALTPDEATVINKLADRNYVITQVRDNASYFRGSFGTWSEVPETVDGYNSDITGSKTPSSNDYMIVRDDSARSMTVAVSSNPVGETLAENVMVGTDVLFFAGHVITVSGSVDDITTLKSHNISYISIRRTGSWRFKYTGLWSSGGKNNWSSEYRINNSSLTEEQIAALNSGITRAKTIQISKNAYDISVIDERSSKWDSAYTETKEMSAKNRSVYTSVYTTSGTWDTVSDKVDNSFFQYYPATAWSLLTDDDTNYTRVPSGLILIYEEDGTPAPIPSSDMCYYFKDESLLLLSKNITYDFDSNTVYIGGGATFNSGTSTLTLPGSSDADSGASFDTTSGIFTFSDTVMWNPETQSITLANGDSYSSANGALTINGHIKGDSTRTTFSIVNHLAHATNNNPATSIRRNEQYIATIYAADGYVLKTLTCTMGGVNVPKTGESSFIISPVTGDIVITATAEAIIVTDCSISYSLVGCTSTNTSTTVLKGGSYTTTIVPSTGYYINSKLCLMNNVAQEWIGNTLSLDYVTGDISITVIATQGEDIKAMFYTVNDCLVLAQDTAFNSANGTLTLGSSVSSLDGGILKLKGETALYPTTTYQITKNLNNVTISNPSSEIAGGSEYSAQLTIDSQNYEYSELSCTMGGVSQQIGSDGNILIPFVTGNIVIIASARKKSVVEYNISTKTLKLQLDARFNDNILYLGRNSNYDGETKSLCMSGETFTNGSSYRQSDNTLILGNNSSFYLNKLTLGDNNTLDGDGVVTLGIT